MSKLSEIRLLFDAKVKEGIPNPPGVFDPRDLERVRNDKYLYRVLEHCSNNVPQAADMLFNLMVWRKTNNANDISEATVNKSYLEEGLYFPRGRDIDSCLLFIMRSKVYVKGEKDVEAVKKIFIYWLERLEREEGGKKVTLFLDMEGCGLSNMDLDVFMYMINVLKNYYPNFINYIIIYQMPWILSAGFKIIKGVLPVTAIDRLRSVNKDKLKDLVVPEQALVSWGGKDNYVFSFIPENRPVDSLDLLQTHHNYSLGEMLLIKPYKVLEFKMCNNQICAQLVITNMDDSLVAFKIRTTAPEKYSVRNSSGILPTRASQTVEIILQTGFFIDIVNKDRFLIVSVQVPRANISKKELSHIWKTAGSSIDEYRLGCGYLEQNKPVTTYNSFDDVVGRLNNNFNITNKTLGSINIKQIFILVLIFFNVIFLILTYRSINRHCNI